MEVGGGGESNGGGKWDNCTYTTIKTKTNLIKNKN